MGSGLHWIRAFFRFFNHKLVESPLFLWVVAITNNRAFDGCSLLAMGALMLHFWLKETSEGRRRIVAIGLVMLLTAVILNQLGQALIPVKRASPTLMLDNIYRVSELLHIPTKDASKDSFPGDHGMMLLIFSAFMLRYFGKSRRNNRPYYRCGFCLPTRNDWRPLAHRYCGWFHDGGLDWPSLVANDAIKRPISHSVRELSTRQKQTIFKQITQSN
ncbi:Putative membrane protein [Citrobacter freundii]|uniref:Membrane protein n=1 Tax=Citrobacter freundii TaxID=546 RepID=A0A7G2IJL3_CITFR|nr:Putative membrane protein [Citrobacter freundii]